MPIDPKTGKEYPYTEEGIAQHKKDTSGTVFNLRSGNTSTFKMMGSSPAKAGPEIKQVDVDDLGDKQETSAQTFENIKNDHNVNDEGIPRTNPEGYWRKAAKHGIYPTDVREQ